MSLSKTVQKTNDILIIDDDPSILEILTEYCSSLDLFRNIITASDGALAGVKLTNQNFAVILLDITLPKKSGTDIIKEFSKYRNNQVESIIIISGSMDQGVIKAAVDAGIKNFLVKPFDELVFSDKVSTVFKKLTSL